MSVKHWAILATIGVAVTAFGVLAETNDFVVLPAVAVWAERERTAVPGIQEPVWAEASSSLSVRGQGEAGTITDLSVNGSAFSEAGVVFNGATVRNAQTEHFNSDLPVSANWLGAPRVLTGLGLFREGAGHSAGSLSVRLRKPDERGGRTTLGVGMNGLVFGRMDDLELFDVSESVRGWVGAFAEAARSDRTDGYEYNPMSRASVGGRFGLATDAWTFDAFAAWQWRDFGCTGSFGANEKYPAWEEDQTAVVSADWKYDVDDDQPVELSFLWTRGRDVYRLYRDNPDFYENRHRSDSVTLHGKTRRHFCDWAFVDLRGDSDAEIYSTTHHNNYSGNDPKTKSEDFRRFRGSVAVLPGVRIGDWEFAVGVAGEFYSEYSASCAPAAGICWNLDEDSKIGLSYREGCRMPSFTELTYDSPDSRGTIGLPLQRTRSLNLDAEWKGVRGGLFLSRSEDLVDWLKSGRSSSWTATALDPVTSFGFSGDAEWPVSESLKLVPRLSLVLKDTSTEYWASRYAMDFPIATFSLEAAYRITEWWRISWRQGVGVWKSNPVRRGSNVQNLSRIETTLKAPFCRGLELTLGLSDLFDQAFEVYPGQKALGFSGYIAVTYRW